MLVFGTVPFSVIHFDIHFYLLECHLTTSLQSYLGSEAWHKSHNQSQAKSLIFRLNCNTPCPFAPNKHGFHWPFTLPPLEFSTKISEISNISLSNQQFMKDFLLFGVGWRCLGICSKGMLGAKSPIITLSPKAHAAKRRPRLARSGRWRWVAFRGLIKVESTSQDSFFRG